MSTEYLTDRQFQDHTITRVEGGPEKGWPIGLSSGWSFYVPPESPLAPRVGMAVRLYGKGIGHTVRGLSLDGRKVFYRTEEGQREHDRLASEERDRERRYDFEKARPDMDRRFDALPSEFRDRLTRFRRHSADFRWRHEGYELFVCELAAAIASGSPTVKAVGLFAASPWESQSAAVPMIGDASGNQVGAAIRLAVLYLSRPADVAREHAAFCPLAGCAEMGCWAMKASVTR